MSYIFINWTQLIIKKYYCKTKIIIINIRDFGEIKFVLHVKNI